MTPSILISLFILLIVLILCLIILISKAFYIQAELEHLSDQIDHLKLQPAPVPPPAAAALPKKSEKQGDVPIRFATFPCPSCDYVHVINEAEIPARRDCPTCGQTVEVAT